MAYAFTVEPAAAPFSVSLAEYLKAQPGIGYNFIATGALVFDKIDVEKPRILLLQRSANDSMPNRWEIPGGACDDEDESILHGVARELFEEAGLIATTIGTPIGDPGLFFSRSGKRICKFSFLVQVEVNERETPNVRLDPKEHQQFVWATESEIKARSIGDIRIEFTTKEQERTVLQGFEHIREGK